MQTSVDYENDAIFINKMSKDISEATGVMKRVIDDLAKLVEVITAASGISAKKSSEIVRSINEITGAMA